MKEFISYIPFLTYLFLFVYKKKFSERKNDKRSYSLGSIKKGYGKITTKENFILKTL